MNCFFMNFINILYYLVKYECFFLFWLDFFLIQCWYRYRSMKIIITEMSNSTNLHIIQMCISIHKTETERNGNTVLEYERCWIPEKIVLIIKCSLGTASKCFGCRGWTQQMMGLADWLMIATVQGLWTNDDRLQHSQLCQKPWMQ